MKKKMISLMMAMLLLLSQIAFAAEVQTAHLSDDGTTLGKYYYANGKMRLDTSRYALLKDGATIGYSGSGAEGNPYLVYRTDGTITGFEIRGYSLTSFENFFTFEVSADGILWKELSLGVDNYYDYQRKGLDTDNHVFKRQTTISTWKRMDYSLKSLDDAYSYLKIVYNGTSHEALIGDVDIAFTAAEKEAAEPDEKIVSAEKQAYAFLRGMGYLSGAERKLSDRMTRREFAQAICALEEIDGGDSPMAVLAQRGYFAATGKYYEDEPIDLQTAVRLTVNMLGYTGLAEMSGGYPRGYEVTAEKLKLYKKINKNAEFDCGAASVLLRNALDATVMNMVSIGTTGAVQYEEVKGKTYLTERKKVQTIEGIVTATSLSGLVDETDLCGEGQIRIGTQTFDVDYEDAEELLGCAVEAYYEEDSGAIRYMAIDNEETTVTEVWTDDIREDTTETSFSYDRGNNKRKISILSTADMILNGVHVPFDADLLKPEIGLVRLIDNNGDDRADVVWVESYQSMKVLKLDNEAKKLWGYTGEVITLKSDDWDTKLSVLQGENKSDETSLRANTVVSVAEGIGARKHYLKIRIGTGNVGGRVGSGEEKRYSIGGIDYNLAENCENAIADGTLPALTSGKNVEADIDCFGNIVWFSTQGHRYGFLRKLTVTDETEDNELDVIARVYTDEGKWFSLQMKDKLTINGEKMPKEDAKEAILAALKSEEKVYTPIRFKLSSDNELTSIETPISLIAETNETVREQARNKDIFHSAATSSGGLLGETRGFANARVYLNDDTKVICVPTANRYDDEGLYKVMKPSEMYNWEYPGTAYDSDEFGQPKLFVIQNNIRSYEVYKGLVPVSEISNAVNAAGDMVESVNGTLTDYDTMYLDISDNSIGNIANDAYYIPFEADYLHKGDLIWTNTEGTKKISDVVKVFDITKWKNDPNYNISMDRDNQFYSIKVDKFSPDRKLMRAKNPDGSIRILSTRNVLDTYLITVSGNKVSIEKITVNDINPDDYLVVYQGYISRPDRMYVYRKAVD